MEIRKILKSSVSILLVLCIASSMIATSGMIVGTAKAATIPSKIEADNGVTYHYINDDIAPDDDSYYLNALQKTNQFEYWASVMYSMLENGGGKGYKAAEYDIYTKGASAVKRDFGYGRSKYGYGTKHNPDVKDRDNGRMIRMVEALKGNTSEATRYVHGNANHQIKNHIVTPKTAVNPASVYNELMNASCFYSDKCTQQGIEKKVDLNEFKNLKSSSKVVYSLFSTDDHCCYDHYTTSMGIMFYNISMVPMCDYLKETSSVQNKTTGESKTYALINDSTVTATLGGGLTETHSESKSNTVAESYNRGFRLSQKFSFNWKFTDPVNFLWKFPSDLGFGLDLGAEEFFQWTDTNTSSETITKQKSSSSNFSMPVPARSIGTVTQNQESAKAVTTYDGPVAITYDVAMFSLGVVAYENRFNVSYKEGSSLFATFSSYDTAESAVDTVNEMLDSKSAGGFNGHFSGGNREQILSSWNNTLNTTVNDDNCSAIIEKLIKNQPMAKFNGTLEEKNASVTYEVGQNYALEPIASIAVSRANEYNDNYRIIRALDLEGDGETFLKYDKIEASTTSGNPFVGWSAKYGYWVLESPDGTESRVALNSSVADENVVVRASGSGAVYVTPIKNEGESYLKYVIVDNHFKYYPYNEKGNSEKAVLIGKNTLKYCTNNDIPEGIAKGKITLNIKSDELDPNRIGLESRVDGDGQISLSKYVAKPGDEIKVTVNAETNGRISSVVAQYHEDKRDPSKVTREEVISKTTTDVKSTFYYTIPENTTSKVSIVAKTKSMNLDLDTTINKGELVLSNNHPYCGEDVTINVRVPEGYGIKELKVEYPYDVSRGPEILGESILRTEYQLTHKFDGDAIISAEVKPLSELKAFDTDENGNFIIGTYDDLCDLSCLANNGINKYIKASYVLANDIDCKGKDWTMIGANGDYFNGTFDGQGYTIKNLNRELTDSDSKNDPLFSVLGEKACVKNLVVDNALVIGTNKTVDGAGAYAKQNNGTIKKCWVTNSEIEMGNVRYLGGMVGVNNGIIEDCAVIDSSISRYENLRDELRAGGIAEENNGEIANSFTYNCTFGEDSKENGAIIERGCAPDNCYYYTNSIIDHEFGTEKTVEEFASGEVAYLINNKLTDGTQGWYQKINADKYPNFKKTDDNTVYNTVFGYDNRNRELLQDSDGNYLIKTFDDLCFMADATNSDIDEFIYAKYVLANDIDCKGEVWTNPIGKNITGFRGTFDGQGHTIKNLNVDSGLEDGKRHPLFARLWDEAVVKNLVIDNACISSSKTSINGAGGITQQNHGTIKECVVKNSTIELGDYKYLGGISGNNNGTIENCAVINCTLSRIGDGVGVRPIGGVVEINHGVLKNCFSYGCTFNNGTSDNGGIAAKGGYMNVVNCYYYTESEIEYEYEFSKAKTAEQFASGEVAYLLGDAFGQKIGADEYPVLGGDKVYSMLKDGNSKEKIYSNTPLLGDVDFDGVITIKDVTIISKYLNGRVELNETQLFYADVNKDGTVDIKDVTFIQKLLQA